MTFKDLTDAQESAINAVAAAASQVADEAEITGRGYLVPVGAMRELRQAVAEWRKANEAIVQAIRTGEAQNNCDECGAAVPNTAPGVTGSWHLDSCSAYEDE